MKLGEHECDVKNGDTVFVPTGEWHEITNGSNEEMVAVQITKLMLEQNTEDRYISTVSTLISILLYKL